MLRKACGLSLIELLVCLAILAIILVNVVTPGMAQWRLKKDIDGVMQELLFAIGMARSHAIAENVMVTLCRSNDGERCQGKWHEGGIIFTDRNADRILNENDRLLYRMQAIKPAGTLTFNSFQNRQYLQMTSRGFTNYQNGNFTFCPADGNVVLARQIIVSLNGRTRFARDSNGDGIAEDSQGKPLHCD